MKTILFFTASLAFGGGWLVLLDAQSAIHEILAGICFLMSSIFFTGYAVIEEMLKLREATEKHHAALVSLVRELRD